MTTNYCEVCSNTRDHGYMADLTLLACAGGAMGDTYLCREHYTLHKFGELTSDEEPCDICADRDAQDPVALNCILNHPQSCECA